MSVRELPWAVTATFLPEPGRLRMRAQVRQALGLAVVLLFVAGLLTLVLLVEWLEHYLEDDLGLS